MVKRALSQFPQTFLTNPSILVTVITETLIARLKTLDFVAWDVAKIYAIMR